MIVLENEEALLVSSLSGKVANGTATEEENKMYRSWMTSQIVKGTAKYNKNTDEYSFTIGDNTITYSKTVYQAYVSGKSMQDALQEKSKANDTNSSMTADQCYDILRNMSQNHTQLDKALSYYAMHYNEINAIDQTNALRIQKGDMVALEDLLLSDDYARNKLVHIANTATAYNATSIYDENFIKKFGSNENGDSAAQQKEKETAEEAAKALLGNASLYLTDQEDFKLPDMGDYYLGNVDSTYLDAISERYENKSDAQAAAHYAESAPENSLGYFEDKDIYFLKANVNLSENDIKNGFMGGDFITLFVDQLNSVKDDNTGALERFINDIAEKEKDYPELAGTPAGNMFELKLLGIDIPQPVRWAYEYNVPKSTVTFKGLEQGKDISYYDNEDYVVSFNNLLEAIIGNKKSSNSSGFNFVFINNKWHQAELIREKENTLDFRWILSAGCEASFKSGLSTDKQVAIEDAAELMALNKATDTLSQLIKSANGEIYIRFEGIGLDSSSKNFPTAMSGALLDIETTAKLRQMSKASTNITASGFNRLHTQHCRRYLGEAFIKTESEFGDVYINLSKYLLGTIENDESVNRLIGEKKMTDYVKVSDKYEGKNNAAFNLQAYDINSKVYADAFFESIDALDDRKFIQQQLFGTNWDEMLDWNVVIGDVAFFVPPVNIRMQTYTHSERMPLLRARGSATKTEQRMNRILSMDIFFNEDRGINGYAYNTVLNDANKTPITYSINGLRAIVAMFKLTPFLPISNNFINKTLGIDAVVVTSLQISSVTSYPKLLQATLTMTEFDWRIYMPDIVQLEAATTLGTAALQQTEVDKLRKSIEGSEEKVEEDTETELVYNDKYRNWFEKTINWKTFRYYYQRPIRRGDYLKVLNYDFNSEEYIYFTCGGLTSLIPMSFQDPTMKFYMANEEYLKEILKARYELLQGNGDNSKISFDEDQLKLLEGIGSLYDDLYTISSNEKFQQDLKTLNEVVKSTDTAFYDVTDALYNLRPDKYYNQGCITNDMSNNPSLLVPLNTCLAQIDKITDNTRAKYNNFFEAKPEYMSIIAKDGKTVSFAIAIKIKQGALDSTSMESFRTSLTALIGRDPFREQGNWEGFIDNLGDINEDRLIIPLTIDVQKGTTLAVDTYKVKDSAMFKLNSDTAAMQLIARAQELHKTYSKKGVTVDTVPDVNSLMNLVYDEYKLTNSGSPGFIVTHWEARMTNRVSQMRSLSSDGFAPQFLGGEDVAITVEIQTTDKQVATMLTAIPKQISRLTRTYHLVMPCIPLRIESEFTKFLGVNEVTCEESYISTVPNQPGLYNIHMQFVSMDRTIREREAANRKAINNSGWNYLRDDEISDYGKGTLMGAAVGSIIGIAGAAAAGWASLSVYGIGAILLGMTAGATAFAGGAALLVGATHVVADFIKLNSDHTTDESAGSGVEQSRKYNQYFEMKKALAEVDLYPDLELPTVAEMEAVGFYFTRYKFQDERLYVDPDFYFIYPVHLTSHIYRELAIHGMDVGIADTTLTDAEGACIKIKPNIGTGYTVVETNDEYDKQKKQADNKRKVVSQFRADQKKNSRQNLKEESGVEMPFMSLLNLTMERDSWSICDQIQGMFLEKKYLKEVKNYEAALEATNAGNVNETRGTSELANTTTADNASETVEQVQTDTGQVKDIVTTEGRYTFNKLEIAISAAETFYSWLSSTTIESTIPSMSFSAKNSLASRYFHNSDAMITSIKTAASTFLSIDEVNTFLKELNIDINDNFINIATNIVCAAACASTGKKEFAGKSDSDDWKPETNLVGVQLGTSQNAQGMNDVIWGNDSSKWEDHFNTIVKRGIEFGPFRFKMLTKSELQSAMYKAEGAAPSKPKEEVYEDNNINNDHYLFDPGYRQASVALIEEYKGKCITSTTYATYAYMRILCYWLCRLVYLRVFPNLSTDIFRKHAELEISTQDTTKELLGQANSEVMIRGSGDRLVSLRKHIDFFTKNMYVIDSGKIWTAAILATSEGDASILSAIENRNYGALNAIVETCSTPSSKISPLNNQGALTIRKMTLALVGLGVINSIGAVGSSQTMPAVASNRDTMQRLFLAAAEDPKQFIPHSFHDMIVNDSRGRMLRAFPTFYMIFIDEGREIGFWKLHDNFYNTSSISSIEVVKSRKLPTDVCTIEMSNFYNSFATETEDYVKTPVATLEQAWNSIFSPSEYFKEQEVSRRNKPQDIKLRLRPGARIHVRMGYGNNANMIPPLFNGIITEVSSEATVSLVAQGDGVELLNPIDIDKEAHNLPNEDDIISNSASNGATPLQIATALFKIHGGLVSEQVRKRLKLNLSPRNPFGIVHFGDPDFTTFCKTGETCQNLYEMYAKPLYGGNADMDNLFYSMDDITRITFDLFQKTPWDVLNICKSISPDARLAVLPFGFRSTVFMGMPHYYYAYDYYKDQDGVVKEKRKPFQQWHIYTAEQDIIGNGIIATNRDVRTVAVGLFQICETFNIRSQQRVGPIYADWDIYNEAQKTMVVDTSLLGKGVPFVGTITNFFSTMGIGFFDSGGVDAFFDDTGFLASAKKIAWRSTATALRESIMDMYAGDLVVFGDPSVKPQDRIFIADKYSGISGQALVKEVVYRMTVEDGFTTTISPDCIAVVNDNTELIKYEAMNRIGSMGAASSCLTADLADSISWTSTAANVAAWMAIGAGTAGIFGTSITKAGSQALEWFRSSKSVQNAANGTLKGAKSALTWLSSKTGSSALASLAARLGTAAGLNAVPFLGQAASVVYLAGMMASTLVMPFINSWIESELKNYKAITIYPLKKYGYVYTAGFEGARGTVYGSPTWGDRGSLGDVFDFLEGYPIFGMVADWIFDDSVKSLAKKYVKDNAIIGSDGKPVIAEEAYKKLGGHLAGSDVGEFADSYHSQQLQPRATTKTPVAMTNAYNYYKRLDTKNWKANLGENRLISQDARIVPYIDEKFFLIAHETPGLPVDGKNVTDETFDIGGNKYRIKAIHTVDGDNNAIIDIPLLNNQALNILYEILRRARNYMPSVNSTDPNEYWEQTKNDYIVLKSALRIGDRTSMGATGFTFVLEGTASNSQRALKSALQNLDAELKRYSGQPGIETDIFQYQQQSNGEISVVVSMPQISEQDDSNTTEEEGTDNVKTENT